ncbi:MAG: hypothetical protein QME88_12015 [Actinomycetota bacterium]|nr:hypothetical protein [Actinomycetota bacterium]
MSIGTSSWLCLSVRRRTNLGRNGIAAVVSPDPEMFLLIGESETAGACLEWFAREMAVAMGAIPSFRAIRDVVRVRKVFHARGGVHETYDRLYGVFRDLYAGLAGACRRLNSGLSCDAGSDRAPRPGVPGGTQRINGHARELRHDARTVTGRGRTVLFREG